MTDTRPDQPASNSSPERESTRQTADLAALNRMLQVSQGCFSLSFAVCNDRALRDDLIRLIKVDFPGLVIVVLPSAAVDVYQLVLKQLAGITPDAIFILDLEASIPSQGSTFPALRTLNSSREAWEKLNCPVVFWLAEYAAAQLATHAPDFWRYRSHQFEFVAERPPDGQTIDGPFPGYEMVDGLSLEEKRFRMAELEQRLSEAGDPPPPGLLPHVLDWLYELAYLHRQGNHFEQSEKLLRQALTLTEGGYGPDAPQSAAPLNNLAGLLTITNHLAEAELLVRRALTITEQSFAADHPMMAFSLNTLAELLTATNRFAEAEPLYRRIVDIVANKFDTDSPYRATSLNNLAQLLHATNRSAEAEPLLRQALLLWEKNLGPEHPDVAICLNNLAGLLRATNRLTEAEPLSRRALAIDEKNFGAAHPKTAIRLNNLASLLKETEEFVEAEALFRRALAIWEKNLGTEHPYVALCLNNLAGLLYTINRKKEAEPLSRRQLQILHRFGQKTGRQHQRMPEAIKNYTKLLKAMGKTSKQVGARLRALLK